MSQLEMDLFERMLESHDWTYLQTAKFYMNY